MKANMGTWKNRVPYIKDSFGIRKITPCECLALLGFPEEFCFPNIITIDDAYKQTGNSVCVIALKKKHIGLFVFVNRYDGIDLPDDACRMLVIDGLPPLRNEKDKYIQSVDSSSNILRREQIQRIEQGMGRGVRSNSDSCCIVLMGDNLADVLLRNNGTSFFSNATKEQYNLSKDLWDLLKQETPKPTVDDVFELADFSLNREVEWIQKSKERLSSVQYSSEPQFDNNALALRKAYDLSMSLQWEKAIEVLDAAINSETQDSTKGYLLQIKAKLTNFVDRSKAQQILLSGRTINMGILAPINGIRYDKAINNTEQAKILLIHLHTFLTSSFLISHHIIRIFKIDAISKISEYFIVPLVILLEMF